MIPGIVAGVAIASSGPTEFIPVDWEQSSTYGTLEATVTNMRDGDFTTGAATNVGGDQWIKADLGSPQTVNSIEVAGGNIPTWGTVAEYLNSRAIQYYNGSTWVTAATISGASNSPPYLVNIPIAGITAQEWRIFGATYTATTEFRFYP